MSIINNGLLLASGADAATTYQISRSLRFNSADSAYLSRTPGSAGNRRTFTVSCWVKRSALSSNQVLLSSNSNNSAAFELAFTSGDALAAYLGTGPNLVTSSVYRDCSAFYHIICAVDTTQSTASDRIKLYVNGTQITAFSASNYPSQNLQFDINNTTAHGIGRESGGTSYFNGYIADFYLLDGTATTPSTFAETDAVTGQWVPKTPTGISYGTNGFRLSFSDNSGTTSTTLGKDSAGSNNWSPNNFSVASGSGNDSLVDSPSSYGTDTGAGGEVRGNYCTLNPLAAGTATLSNGNLDAATGNAQTHARGTIGITSGKWYWEIVGTSNGNNGMYGIVNQNATFSNFVGSDANGWAYYADGQKYTNASNSNYGASFTNSDVIGVAFDADNGTLTFYKNGTSQGQAFSGLTSGPYFPAVSDGSSSVSVSLSINFGARAFSYQAPSGFKALCDTNLTAPTIAKPNTVMDVKLYTGNAGNQTISGLSFSPDFIWTKSRSQAYSHNIYDSVRGISKNLFANETSAENTDANTIKAFNSDGFQLGSNDNGNYTNNGSAVAWCWDAGSSTVTNNVGSITSSVRANASAGFSIVGYTGNGSSGATVGHGGLVNLDKGMIIIKKRTSSPGNTNWRVYHSALGNTQAIYLSDTGAATSGSGFWNNTSPTSTVFTLGSDDGLNASSQTHIAYCFAPVAGYSTALSWTGNGSSDGPLLHCGFSPRFFIAKRTDAANDWWMWDTARSNTGNPVDEWLSPNRSDAEYGNDADFDFLSNGIKIRNTSATVNASGGTYIGFAWASNPFQYARAQ